MSEHKGMMTRREVLDTGRAESRRGGWRMRALSIRQPWAHLIIIGQKNYENRTWGVDYRGPLLIHAGKAWDPASWTQTLQNGRPGRWIERGDMQTFGVDGCVPRGALIGYVQLVGCGVAEEAGPNSPWAEPYCVNWYLQKPVEFDRPIPWRGQLGLFDVTLEDINRENEPKEVGLGQLRLEGEVAPGLEELEQLLSAPCRDEGARNEDDALGEAVKSHG